MRIPVTVAALLATAIVLGASRADDMPNFARKLGVGCATCHTTIPKLNETGFKSS